MDSLDNSNVNEVHLGPIFNKVFFIPTHISYINDKFQIILIAIISHDHDIDHVGDTCT